MISKKFIIFFLVFIVFQYILLITEWKPYLDMYSDIQGYKHNFFKSQYNKLKLNSLIIMTMGYPCYLFTIYKIIGEKLFSINIISFLIVILTYFMWDVAYYSMLENATSHYLVLLYDVFIVGGLCLILTQFIFNKFYKILEKNIPILCLLYVTAMFSFLYVSFKYNPDISNITGIYKPHHTLFFILFISIASYILLKLK